MNFCDRQASMNEHNAIRSLDMVSGIVCRRKLQFLVNLPLNEYVPIRANRLIDGSEVLLVTPAKAGATQKQGFGAAAPARM